MMVADRSVGASPGRTALTRIPAWPSSSAAQHTSISTAAFVAQYGAWNREVRSALTDEIATNDPSPAAAMCGAAARNVRNVRTTRPALRSRSAACSSTGARRPVIVTTYPEAARRSAQARPMPLPPPVTSACRGGAP